MGVSRKRKAEKQDEQAQTARERKTIDVGSGAISERKVRKSECARKGGFAVETRGAESKGVYDEHASTTTTGAESAHALFACKRPK